MRPTKRVRINLTDDEVRWLLCAHRARLVELITWPAIAPNAKALVHEALSHHEARIELFKSVERDRRHVVAEG